MTSSNNITLRNVKVKPCEFHKMYIDKDLVEDKPYQLIDQFNERKISPIKFYLIFLNKIHPFSDGSGRTSGMLFANDDEKIKLFDEAEV